MICKKSTSFGSFLHILMNKKIVLLGYMGSGKSTIGSLLAEKLGIQFVDLDDHIENKLQQSISEIFAQKGEIFFRKQEHLLLKEVLESPDDMVLALGGGTPCYSNNMQLVLDLTPHVFYLRLSVSALTERLLLEKDHRPMISHLEDEELMEFIGKHLFERRNFYELAHYSIAADQLNADEILDTIQSSLV